MPRSEVIQVRIDPDLKANAAKAKGDESWQSLFDRWIREFVHN